MRVARYVLLASLGLLLCACGSSSPPQTALVTGGYMISLSHQPNPLQVGYTAKLEVTIGADKGQFQRGCQVSYRRFMPDMAMAEDGVSVVMLEGNGGVYQAETATFSMAGEWVLEVTMDCGTGTAIHPFHYRLEWPE